MAHKLNYLRLIVLVLICVSINVSYSANPTFHKSTRALAMGNAFVAVADDKDAIYYNPAGLWYMNRMGNYKLNPELGHYPLNYFDMRMNVGVLFPLGHSREIYTMTKDIEELIKKNSDIVDNGGFDSLAGNQDLVDRIYAYDRKNIFVGSKVDLELAFHASRGPAFAGAIWADVGIAPHIDAGIISPAIVIDTVYADLVVQGATAFAVSKKVLLGLGYKLTKREYREEYNINISNWSEQIDSIQGDARRIVNNLNNFKTVGHSIDLGMNYIHSPEFRYALVFNDIYFTKLYGDKIRPDLTVGMAFSPKKLQRNTKYARKINLAADFADILKHSDYYNFFSHLNFGVELHQVILALPGNRLNDNLRIIKARLSAGFQGGYISSGLALELLRVIQVEFVTWGEEAGHYTGQKEARYYLGQISLGF